MQNSNEKMLIERCKKGDSRAYEELIAGYEKKVFNIVYRVIGDYNDAEDISQEVFIKVFKSINSFKEKSSFYTWLYRIAVNECIDIIKKRKKSATYSLDSPIQIEGGQVNREIKDTGALPEEKIERMELQKYIELALNSVSYEHRIILVLRDIQGFSYKEIAEIVKCPPGTVKSRINRARKAIKELLIGKMELFKDYKV